MAHFWLVVEVRTCRANESGEMATSKMPVMGIYWTNAEVEAVFRALHREGAGQRVMTSTNVESTDIFQSVSNRLEDQGKLVGDPYNTLGIVLFSIWNLLSWFMHLCVGVSYKGGKTLQTLQHKTVT